MRNLQSTVTAALARRPDRPGVEQVGGEAGPPCPGSRPCAVSADAAAEAVFGRKVAVSVEQMEPGEAGVEGTGLA